MFSLGRRLFVIAATPFTPRTEPVLTNQISRGGTTSERYVRRSESSGTCESSWPRVGCSTRVNWLARSPSGADSRRTSRYIGRRNRRSSVGTWTFLIGFGGPTQQNCKPPLATVRIRRGQNSSRLAFSHWTLTSFQSSQSNARR